MKGSNAERELRRELWEHGYATLRAPGSGSINLPSPDVIALGENSGYAIELKNTQDGTATFESHEIKELEEWSTRAGVEPWIVVRPDLRQHDQWYCCPCWALNETETGFSLRKEDHGMCFSLAEAFLDAPKERVIVSAGENGNRIYHTIGDCPHLPADHNREFIPKAEIRTGRECSYCRNNSTLPTV